MAITNYTTLKAAVASWLNRSDLSSDIDTFIDLAEAQIQRRLRIRAMETAMSVTLSGGVAAVPASYLELKYAYIDGSPTHILSMQTPEWIHRNYPNRATSSVPRFIARDADNFVFGPYPDSDYTLKGTYYAPLTALSASNETNWLITNAPDLYLAGALVEGFAFIGDDPSSNIWGGRFASVLGDLNGQEEAEQWPRSMPLQTSVG